MKVLVLGAGKMGLAIVFDLARSSRVESLTLGDADGQRAEEVAKKVGGGKTSSLSIDVRDQNQVIDLMRGYDVTVSAVTLYHNDSLVKAAVEARTNFCDLGGSDSIVTRQKALDEVAKKADITIVPNCGLAPGMANVVAVHGMKLFEKVSELYIRVGGLPQHPTPPFNYQGLFSVEGLLKEYTERAKVLREGKLEYVEPLTGIEAIEFPEPSNSLEAFYTSGGASLLPELLRGKVNSLDYKTIRYTGHAEKMKTLLDIGFASTDSVRIRDQSISPRESFGELLKMKLSSGDKDIVLMRVIIQGIKAGKKAKVVFTMIDRFDDHSSLTAMMRTTAFPTSIIAQMIGGGEIMAKGVHTPEECVPAEIFMEGLRRRGIFIEENWN